MATTAADSLQQVVAALNALYNSPSNSAKKEANLWLESFQAMVIITTMPMLIALCLVAKKKKKRKKAGSLTSRLPSFSSFSRMLARGMADCRHPSHERNRRHRGPGLWRPDNASQGSTGFCSHSLPLFTREIVNEGN